MQDILHSTSAQPTKGIVNYCENQTNSRKYSRLKLAKFIASLANPRNRHNAIISM